MGDLSFAAAPSISCRMDSFRRLKKVGVRGFACALRIESLFFASSIFFLSLIQVGILQKVIPKPVITDKIGTIYKQVFPQLKCFDGAIN